jgi:FkbM family methyltransferase
MKIKQYLYIILIFITYVGSAEYHSQCKQDEYINNKFFKNKHNGVFLDIGAHDGIIYSNTCFFEKELGWKGICLEPIPEVYEQLIRNRNSVCIKGCATYDGIKAKDFLRITGPLEMLSGLIDSYDSEHVERIERQLTEYGGHYEVIRVPCFNINEILNEYGISRIDFLSLDTEGGEYHLLQNIDFDRFKIDVIAVEDNYHKYPFVEFLTEKGYFLDARLEQDLIFIHKNFKLDQ